MWNDFKTFVMRGNVVDLAVGVIIGAAFGKIVTSLVNDIIMPPFGLLLGRVDFSELFVDLSGQSHPTLAAAKEAGAPTLNYGLFINTTIEFLIVAFAVFVLIRQINKLQAQPVPPPPSAKECPYCRMSIPLAATRCPQCTSDLKGT